MTAPVLTLFEHQTYPYAQIPLFSAYPARRERVLEALESLNTAAGQEIIQVGRKALRTHALVGILRAGDLTVEILPKIGWASGAGASTVQSRASARNLMVMLSYAFNLKIIEQETAGLASSAGAWFEILTRLFVSSLSRQAAVGLSQHYIEKEDTLSALRGRWDIQRQIQRRGPAHPGFDVIFDEYSPDTPLNQVFRFTIEHLLLLDTSPACRAGLEDLRQSFSAVTCPNSISPALLESVGFNRLNERFRPAFNLARLLLSGHILQLSVGTIRAGGFVFDMNMLFERFMAAFIERYRASIFPASWQGAVLHPQSEGMQLYLARWEGRRAVRLRPDLLITRKRSSDVLLFADTKYKKIDAARSRPATAPEDIYQMLAYAAGLNCPRGLLLYPQSMPGSPPIRQRLEIDAASLDLMAATVNLHTPLHEPEPLVQELKEIFQWAAQAGKPNRLSE